MTFQKFIPFDETIGHFYREHHTGVFLFDLLPKSSVAVFHDISPVKGYGNGVVVIGHRDDQEKLGLAITKNLLHKEQRDGFWDSAIFHDDLLIIVYAYRDLLEPDQIIELLSLKLRYDLAHVCEIELSDLSLLQVKIKGEIYKNIPIQLPSEQTLLQSLKKTVFFKN